MNPKNTLLLVLLVIPSVFNYAQDYWEVITTLPDSTFSRCIDISPEGDIYLGMRGFEYPGGIYRSTDNAQTWEYLGLTEKPVYTIEVCPSGDILAGVFAGIYKSNDGGGNWYQTYWPIGNITNILSLPNGYIFAGGTMSLHGIIRSMDFGETWDTVHLFTNVGEENMETITVSPDGEIWVGTHNIFGSGSIWFSNNLGDSWTELNAPYNPLQAYSLAFHPLGELFVGCLGYGIYRYNFISGQWAHDNFNATPDDILFVGSDKIYLGCSGFNLNFKGILYSDDGGQNYTVLNSGMNSGNGTGIYTIIRHPNNIIYAEGWGFYRSVEPVYTGLEDQNIPEVIQSFSYPNPFKTKTTINWDNSGKDKLINLIIVNSSGKEITNVIKENNGSYVFHNNNNEPGIFFYSIIGQNNIQSGKIVLVK